MLVRVLVFACTLFAMLHIDAFDVHATWHATAQPCRRARPDLRAGALNAPRERSDSVRRDSSTV